MPGKIAVLTTLTGSAGVSRRAGERGTPDPLGIGRLKEAAPELTRPAIRATFGAPVVTRDPVTTVLLVVSRMHSGPGVQQRSVIRTPIEKAKAGNSATKSPVVTSEAPG